MIPLVLYTLFILYRNTLSGLRAVPAEVLESARGMGLTPTQTFLRVELPPRRAHDHRGASDCDGLDDLDRHHRCFPRRDGLGKPIFDALKTPDIFKTELVAASALVVGLALVADGLLALLQRALTPWERVR